MRLLVLHDPDGEPIYINPAQLVGIGQVQQEGLDAHGMVYLANGAMWGTRESAAAIARYWEREQHIDKTGRYPRQEER